MRVEYTEPENEKQVQALIVKGLKDLGYLVQETSIKVRGKRTRWNMVVGIDAGISDLLIGRDGWGPIRLCLEVKGPETPLSPEQKDLHSRGLIRIVRSLDDALKEVQQFQLLSSLPGPKFEVIA